MERTHNMARRKKKASSSIAAPAESVRPTSRFVRLFGWLTASGLLVALLAGAYQHLVGNVALEFVQPLGRGYEFQLKNDTPSDRTVRSFRMTLPPQRFVFTTTEDVPLPMDESGRAIMPPSHVPVVEFKDLDGRLLPANSSLKFRVPPLTNLRWMRPDATIVDVQVDLSASNPLLASLDAALQVTGLRLQSKTVRYLVIDNYWTVTDSTSLDEAIRVYCRETDSTPPASRTCRNLP